MAERGHDAGRQADEDVARPAGFEHGAATEHPASEPLSADAQEDARHRRVMASAERVMGKHRNVFAALAK